MRASRQRTSLPAGVTARARRAALLAGILTALNAHAQAVPEPGAPPLGTQAAPATGVTTEVAVGPLYAMPTRMDRVGRVLAPVMVNGRGPFRFIVDTGASRSALSFGLAQSLGLTTDSHEFIEVRGVTGSAVLPAATVNRLTAGDLVVENVRMPVLEGTVLADADGILGVEGLRGKRLEIDFERDRVTITRSSRPRYLQSFLRVPVRLRLGDLLVVDAKVGEVRAKAILDTGAQRTLGNLALRDALAAAGHGQADSTQTDIVGATSSMQSGLSHEVPRISLGEAELRGVEVTFGDLHVFEIWELLKQPALVVGMDVLGTVRTLVIDYSASQVMIRP